ncbi:hypothetical protein LTR53_016746, partial [Teratosphaeriaceae sp. CCFEE 6253]
MEAIVKRKRKNEEQEPHDPPTIRRKRSRLIAEEVAKRSLRRGSNSQGEVHDDLGFALPSSASPEDE